MCIRDRDLFHRLHREQGKTIVLITHSPELAGECQRIVTIKDGRVTGCLLYTSRCV